MKHSIIFENRDNKWDNALPLGNGCFGAMLYFEDKKLHMPMNHYEIYYNIEKNTLPADKLKNTPPSDEPGGRFGRFLTQAYANEPTGDEPFCDYYVKRKNLHDSSYVSIDKFSSSYPATGNLTFHFDEALQDADQRLTLFVEDAKAELHLQTDADAITTDVITARRDCIITHILQTRKNLLHSVEFSLPPQRDAQYPEVCYKQVDDHTFAYTVTRHWDEEDAFSFSGIIRLVGARGTLTKNEYGATIKLTEAKNSFVIITGIFTEWNYKNPLSEGLLKMDSYEQNLSVLLDEHRTYWQDVFTRFSISVPDTFLETAYYVNLYALDCSSGKDGIMKHHACGLNGLWDIKHPTLWGSMWYWDINIQSSFACVFSGNRLDLAKVFSDGLLSYTELAKRFAKDVHNREGLAGDFPHCCFFCIWAWCAQYLWFLYEYSLDEAYLKNEAYPLFVDLCKYYLKLFVYDEKKGYYSIFPDISPEQGPFVHDSVITVSSVKYLFQFTVKAAEILGDTNPVIKDCRKVMQNMAPYPVSKDGDFGVHLKDAEETPDNMWIRHPSMLMPVFPTGEFDAESDEAMVEILRNTVYFLEERMELGVFGGSFLATAAARLGMGQTALRLLYERGMDHMLRSNGLCSEKTERFTNHCLVPRQPLYHPCMMEFAGAMPAAVNEMLLQSQNGIIRVFPALPDGSPEYCRLHRHGYPINEYKDRYAEYATWKTLSFETLLAKGAFEVSASLTEGRMDYIQIHSQKGGTACVASPFMRDDFSVFENGKQIPFRHQNDVLSFETAAGGHYLIATTPDVKKPEKDDSYHPAVLSRKNYIKRHIFLGENPETAYHKAVDSFIRDWYVGNARLQNHTAYKFDFSTAEGKCYTDELTRQAFVAEEKVHYALPFCSFPDGDFQFTIYKGYGFDDAAKCTVVKRSGPDLLRQDFVEGTEEITFMIDAPRGQYELLVISGDSEEDSVTVVEAVNGRKAGGELIKKGQYQCKLLPLVNESDEPIRLKISTTEGHLWKLNFIMLNCIKGH